MPDRFYKVTDGLYRGGGPTPEEVHSILKNIFNINKIISLDEQSGNAIHNSCKVLGIEHIQLSLCNGDDPKVKILEKLIPTILKNGPTYIHCKHGKDRTGIAVAMFRIYNGWPIEKALQEAASIGMGKGLNPKTAKTYYDAVKNYNPKDRNDAEDIVSITREQNKFGPTVPNPFVNNFMPGHNYTSTISFITASYYNAIVKFAQNQDKIYRKCQPKDLLKTNSFWYKTKESAINSTDKGILYSSNIDTNANFLSLLKNNNISLNDIPDNIDVVNLKNNILIVYPSVLINIMEEDLEDINEIVDVGQIDSSTNHQYYAPFSGSGIGGMSDAGETSGGMPIGAAGFPSLPFTGPGQI